MQEKRIDKMSGTVNSENQQSSPSPAQIFARKPIRHESCQQHDCICVHRHQTQQNSFATLVKSLILSDCKFNIEDILKYAILAVGIFIVMLYIFPLQIILILLLLLLIVMTLARVTLISSKNSNQQYMNTPIDSSKLEEIRAKLRKNKEN